MAYTSNGPLGLRLSKNQKVFLGIISNTHPTIAHQQHTRHSEADAAESRTFEMKTTD